MDLQEFLADSDWRDAFGEAMGVEPEACTTVRRDARATVGFNGNTDPFARSDVKEIIAISNGQNDERDWIGAFRLNDGRYAFVRAGCDYTGWDCMAGGDAEVSSSLEDLIRYAMSDEERARLGFNTIGTSSPTGAFDDIVS